VRVFVAPRLRPKQTDIIDEVVEAAGLLAFEPRKRGKLYDEYGARAQAHMARSRLRGRCFQTVPLPATGPLRGKAMRAVRRSKE